MPTGSLQDTRGISTAICLLLLHLIALSVSDDTVMGSVNDTLTLPYTYSVHKYTHSVCWGRGRCTLSGCNDVILQTDGSRVTWRTSDRYQLLGNIPQGDVSLTITGVTEEDEGTYCCPSQGEIPVFHTDVKKQPTTMRQEMFYTHRNISYIPTMLPLEKTTLTLQKTESSSLSNYQVYRIAGYVTLILMIYLVMILYRLTRTHG
ncbi:hepatitis A virus cellular receptor 1 homolog isoform X3 [Mixophyes fleayi]|uniref:hepatitis A virus cellular receptor 1 homolog isoform X3 n=1 Tax=Mixophyes fleayi TaxID=3061075 RepID=UPI003F4E2150